MKKTKEDFELLKNAIKNGQRVYFFKEQPIMYKKWYNKFVRVIACSLEPNSSSADSGSEIAFTTEDEFYEDMFNTYNSVPSDCRIMIMGEINGTN